MLDDAIQNSDHTDYDQCYWALDELCKHALYGMRRYDSVTSIRDFRKVVKRDMYYVQGLMSKEQEKAYLDDEWKRINGKEEGKK